MSGSAREADPYRPPIVLRRSDHERLTHLAVRGLLSTPRDAGALLQEIERATVLDDGEVDAATIVIGSRIRFRTGSGGEPHEATLVLQGEADETAGRVSVLTNLGAGLLGLSKGQTILWPDRVGGRRRLTILDVQPPGLGGAAEPAGAASWPSPDASAIRYADIPRTP
jgi:regulator of nucleoside diphosphate kinase